MKHTHTGHCQACGRIQAITPRGIAKHGYKVAGFHYFVGTCQGSDNVPLQKSHELTDLVLIGLDNFYTMQLKIIEEYSSGKRFPDEVNSGNSQRNKLTNKLETIYISWDEANEYQRELQLKRDIAFRNSQADMAKYHITQLTQLKTDIFGTNEIPVNFDNISIKIEPGIKFFHMEVNYEVFCEYRAGFNKRVTGWICKDLNTGKKQYISSKIIRDSLKQL